jgi:AraC-like DNA-binding protein
VAQEVVRVKKVHSVWKGFELEPQGVLLNQFIDMSGEMGIAYERSHAFYKDFHTHDRPIFVFPRGSCAMEVHTRPGKAAYTVDATNCLMVPSNIEHDDEGLTPIYDTFAILPSTSLIDHVTKKKGVQSPPSDFFKQVQEIERSDWLGRLIEEYFFEKVVANRLGDDSLRFFEEHILIEIFRIVSGSDEVELPITPSENIDQNSSDPLVAKALKFIEGNLFNELTLKSVAEKSHASESTLQRRFKAATGLSPMDYARMRRLDEAAQLLKKNVYSVTEVAMIVGYSNVGAFSEAFKLQHGTSPSSYGKES